MSSTHKRLVQEDICEGLGALIPDTDGRGNANGSGAGGGRAWVKWTLIVLVSHGRCRGEAARYATAHVSFWCRGLSCLQ